MSVIHEAKYKVLEVMDLPYEIRDELCNDCPCNDSGRIIYTENYPLLINWLRENGHSVEKCYIGWWSW